MEKKKTKISLQTALIICLIVLVIIFLTEVIVYNITSKEITTETDQKTEIAIECNDFATSFLKLENNKKNMIYSPLSIKYALKMLEEGADGNTKKQIEKILENQEFSNYKNIDKVLSFANAIYIRDTYSKSIKDSYKNTLMQKYNAEVKYDAFKNATNVNNWIKNKTLGIIEKMLEDGDVQDPNVKMILINALAIDMRWKNGFESDETFGKDFYLANGGKMNATTMNKETSDENFSYYKDNNKTVLAMNLQKYEDKQLEFIAIMPNKDLSEYIKTFSTEELNSITKNLINASKTKNGIDISIPKFKFEYDLELKDDLKDMGITDAFDAAVSDLSLITGNKDLYVDDALHKADIEFSEDGIKAAAVTVIITKLNAMMPQEKEKPIEVKIDKPFLFVIRDKDTNEIWFLGTVYEPNSWENDKTEYQK